MSIDRDRVIRNGHEATSLKDNEFLAAILAEIEQDGVERAVAASINDHETRASAIADIRAARSLVSKLTLRIAEAQSMVRQRGGNA
jgi:hypothetical protein